MVVILNFVSFPSYCVERVFDACNLVNTNGFLTKVCVIRNCAIIIFLNVWSLRTFDSSNIFCILSPLLLQLRSFRYHTCRCYAREFVANLQLAACKISLFVEFHNIGSIVCNWILTCNL